MALELPILKFITTRLKEADVTLEVRAGTAYYDLFIKPQQLLLQPLLTAMELSLTSQSVLRIKNTGSVDAFDEDLVDQLTQNLYVFRSPGGYGTAIVRVSYSAPADKQFPSGSAEFLTATGLSFFNSTDVSITKAEMTLNTIGDLYYVDIPVIAQTAGTDYNVVAGGIVAFVNDVEAITVTNLADVVDGLPRQTNTEVLSQVERSIGVRDFETGKGIVAIINQNFPGIFSEITPIGFGDPEMQRDIVYNAHVGGNTDVYLKTPALQTLTKDVVGLVFDNTRALNKVRYKQLLGDSFTDPSADLKTPYIVVGSMVVKSDTIETAAHISSAHVPAVIGINLAGKEFVKLRIDSNGTYVNIKVSGANPASTQRFEIINSINAALGETVAVAFAADQVLLKSQTIGFGSEIDFATPNSPRTDATSTLFPAILAAPYNYISGTTGVGLNPAATVLGTVAVTYIETADYQVDYLNGLISKLPGSAILSGDTIVGPLSNGVLTAGSGSLTSPTLNQFSLVQPGDEVHITASTVLTPGTYVVKEKIDNQTLALQGVHVTLTDTAVHYYIVSNQVVVLKYQYNPLSIDIGGQVLLTDGVTRGVRPGRDAYTISNVPFIDIVSIEEIDSDTLEGLGIFVQPTRGYGAGGFGVGAYGIGSAGDYGLVVNSPKDRFSVFEDSLLTFDPALFGKSYRVTYYGAPEIASVHNLSRSDLERVTGASVLPKNYVPGFVDVTVQIKRDPTNINTPSNQNLVILVSNLINAVTTGNPLKASAITQLLENQGITYVVLPFTMAMTIVNTDGTNTIRSSQNLLQLEKIVLPSATTNYVTQRIMQMYARNIVVEEI